ncbi:hypothetical protein HDU76_003444 [Blyttiomyces sp. JEL0837]|nr:hypothetical protein HDU76_003444 [Blyttiomyces sp. JEL0837]
MTTMSLLAILLLGNTSYYTPHIISWAPAGRQIMPHCTEPKPIIKTEYGGFEYMGNMGLHMRYGPATNASLSGREVGQLTVDYLWTTPCNTTEIVLTTPQSYRGPSTEWLWKDVVKPVNVQSD